MTEEDLQVCINAYRQDKIGDDQILQVFQQLATLVFSSPSYHFNHPNTESVLSEAADLCLCKLGRYDATKGKACFYFTTIIGCWLRQSKGHLRRLNSIK